MTEQRFGKVIARGDAAFIALVKLALDECVNQRIETLPFKDYVIEEHTVQEFIAKGFVFADGTVNEGRVVGGTLWINSRVVDRRPGRARHIVRHEIAHVIPLSTLKRQQLMAKMNRKDGTHPTEWRGGLYQDKPSECFADTFAEAVSGIDSPWDDFVYYRLDVDDPAVATFVPIVMTPDGGPEAPTVGVDPLPPIDARVPMLEAQVASLTTDLKAANKRLATIHAASAPL